MFTPRIRPVLALAALVAFAACSKPEEVDSGIDVASVERRTITIDAEATGVIEPINVIEVKSRASGQITALPVETGSQVKPGDLLVQLDTREMRNQYDQSIADERAADARFQVAQAQRRRSEELFRQQVITSQELEASSLELENAQAAMIRARSNSDLSRQRLEDATVTAPTSGTVISRLVSPGQVIVSATNSASGGTALLMMADLAQVQVRAMVNESDIGKIQPGQVARVTVDAYPNRPFTGTVEKIEPQAVIDQSVTMFPVLVRLENQEGLLMPGMNGEVSVLVERKADVLAVPSEAIRTMRDTPGIATMLGLDSDAVMADIQTQMASLSGGSGQPAPAGGDATGPPVTPPGGTAAPAGRATPTAGAAPAAGARRPGGQASRAGGSTGAAMQFAAQRQGGGGGGMRAGRRAGAGAPAVVFVVRDSTYIPRVVLTGVSDYEYTEVIRGLEEGEVVAMLASIALQAARQQQNDRMRARVSTPGLERTTTTPAGGR